MENWRSKDVRRDSEGFLKAQQAEREWKEAKAKKQQEQDDLECFTLTFVAEGGDSRDAEEEWRRTRSEADTTKPTSSRGALADAQVLRRAPS